MRELASQRAAPTKVRLTDDAPAMPVRVARAVFECSVRAWRVQVGNDEAEEREHGVHEVRARARSCGAAGAPCAPADERGCTRSRRTGS